MANRHCAVLQGAVKHGGTLLWTAYGDDFRQLCRYCLFCRVFLWRMLPSFVSFTLLGQ